MCGIAGFWTEHPGRSDPESLELMSRALRRRGPDDSGRWSDAETGLHLAHRRLSVIDTSAAGHQPMESRCGRYVVVYNGEIYNHLELRADLERDDPALRWRGTSDTETLLASVQAWGFPDCLQRWNGMFAIALWDRHARRLYLARDRMGEKPLYFGVHRGVLMFGSELSALRAHPAFDASIDRASVVEFLRHSSVPSPHSIFVGIGKLAPACWIMIDGPAVEPSAQQVYWDLPCIARDAAAESSTATAEERRDALGVALDRAVSSRMIADVPLGAFLSGGIDSSLVVALMQRNSSTPVRTFSIGFELEGYDEAPHARRVAEHLGTAHTELYLSAGDALEVVPALAGIWSEPFSDSSQIPTYLVSRLARESVTVALSGDGGDELFGGYRRYVEAERIWSRLATVPAPLRSLAASVISGWVGATGRGPSFGAGSPGSGVAAALARSEYLGPLLSSSDQADLYRRMTVHWKHANDVVIGSGAPREARHDAPAIGLPTALDRMMLRDCLGYLPDVILTKVDRASMAASLEARAPLLDHRLVELAWTFPTAERMRGGAGKAPLRDELHKHVPKALVERPKMGFGVPIGAWLRGPLRDWGESLVSTDVLRRQGVLKPAAIRRKWEEHQSGQRDWQFLLWDVLMFQSWYAHNFER